MITEIDPDYHWSDSFRTSRSSNEASQRILNQMSCRLRRQMGRKALEMGGNSILSYQQWIDIESYAQTITMRGLGTAAIMHLPERGSSSTVNSSDGSSSNDSETADALESKSAPPMRLQSKGIELATITRIPSRTINAISGVVSAKSVKLMSEESEYSSAAVRDKWLSELREEMKNHARNLGCNIVLGYQEHIAMHDDMYLIYAEGTACRIRPKLSRRKLSTIQQSSDIDNSVRSHEDTPEMVHGDKSTRRKRRRIRDCQSCHFPRHRLLEISVEHEKCNLCRRAFVTDLILATVDMPNEVEIFGEQSLVEGYVCRPIKRTKDGELAAHSVSVNLAFVEYELYRQLHFKLRYNGFNAAYGLKYHFLTTDQVIIAVVSGTGACLAALPKAKPLQISRNIAIKDREDREIFELQEIIAKLSLEKQQKIERMYQSRFPSDQSSIDGSSSSSSSSDGSLMDDTSTSSTSSSSESDQESIVQIDDEVDEDLLLTMSEFSSNAIRYWGTADILPPIDVTEQINSRGGASMTTSQFICQFRRFTIQLDVHHPSSLLAAEFARQYREIAAQVRGIFSREAAICCLKHHLNIVRGFEVQVTTTATAVGLVYQPVATPQQLLQPSPLYDDSSDNEPSVSEEESKSPTTFVHFSTCSSLPSSVFNENSGTITLQLFKEIYYHECSGGFPGFVASALFDLFAIAKASSASLGGNALTCISFRPSNFYENFKNQLHAVVFMTADVINVEFDDPDAWKFIQQRV